MKPRPLVIPVFIAPFGEWEKNPRLSAKALAGP